MNLKKTFHTKIKMNCVLEKPNTAHFYTLSNKICIYFAKHNSWRDNKHNHDVELFLLKNLTRMQIWTSSFNPHDFDFLFVEWNILRTFLRLTQSGYSSSKNTVQISVVKIPTWHIPRSRQQQRPYSTSKAARPDKTIFYSSEFRRSSCEVRQS